MKKALLRGLIGFPIGVTIGYAISILSSLAYADGKYSSVVPGMSEQFGSEITAVAVQFILCGLMGGAFAAMSAIWENDRLSLAAQSAINFALSAVVGGNDGMALRHVFLGGQRTTFAHDGWQ